MYSSPASISLERVTFPCLLQGSERVRAHIALMDAFCGTPDEKAAMGWLTKDVSLLVEPLSLEMACYDEDERFPVGGAAVWEHAVLQHGTWAHRALSLGMSTVVRALIDRGLHPDERSALHGETVLGQHQWRTNPDLLRAALEAGADVRPRVNAEGLTISPCHLRRLLLDIRSALAQDVTFRVAYVLNYIKCAHLLMDFGDDYFDLPLDEGSAEARRANVYTLGAVGHLVDIWPKRHKAEEAALALRGLITRMVTLGADVDRRGGPQLTPPVVRALRCLNPEAACHLIGLGARVDDAWLCRPASQPGGLMEDIYTEAEKAGGGPFVAAVTEAMMRRRVQRLGPHAALNDVVAGVARRQRRL